ncbi:hypothetical protein GCM10023176_56990 [Micromonospora coerulea]|uniref:Uncharacterized protein n=1 Tax=Micromonospora coerulea TaxID=47856 RepID=A0ABP8T0X6_9ACTN
MERDTARVVTFSDAVIAIAIILLALEIRPPDDTRHLRRSSPTCWRCSRGHRLLNAALIRGYPTRPALGGVLLRLEHCDLVVASLGDEWVLRQGRIPPELATYLTVDRWLGDQAVA